MTRTLISSNPNPVVSGGQRQGQIKFVIPEKLGSQLAYFSVAAVSSAGLRHTMRCPVFYRSDATTVNRTILNNNTLSKMTELYLGRKFQPRDNFSKAKISGEVSWVRPVSASTLRRSVQELRPNSSRARSAISALSGSGRTQKNRPHSSAVHVGKRTNNNSLNDLK